MRAVKDSLAAPLEGEVGDNEKIGMWGVAKCPSCSQNRGGDGGRWSSVLAQRAASKGPRWTRAVEDQSAPIPRERKRASLERAFISSDALDAKRCGL